MDHVVQHRDAGQDQNVVFTRSHFDPVRITDPEPSLGDLGDLCAVALDPVLVVDDVALDVQIRAAFELDDPPFPQRRDHGLLDHRDPVPVRSLDLHTVFEAQHAFLDLAELAPVHVLEQDRLADPQGLAVKLEHPLAAVVLDHVIVADGDHALAHQITRGFGVEAPFLPPSAAHRLPPIPVSRCASVMAPAPGAYQESSAVRPARWAMAAASVRLPTPGWGRVFGARTLAVLAG